MGERHCHSILCNNVVHPIKLFSIDIYAYFDNFTNESVESKPRQNLHTYKNKMYKGVQLKYHNKTYKKC